jgi:hypothetical protein
MKTTNCRCGETRSAGQLRCACGRIAINVLVSRLVKLIRAALHVAKYERVTA